MPKRTSTVPSMPIPLDPSRATPLYRQVYDGLRAAILSGRLAAGARLPATRTLAQELGVSRNTVLTAFEQLHAEGYLEGRIGAGSFVARTLPEEALQARAATIDADGAAEGAGMAGRWARAEGSVGSVARRLSDRGRRLAAIPVTASLPGPPRPFRPGIPAFDAFPFETWARLAVRRLRRPPNELLGYGDPAGYAPLRAAIAAHLGSARAVRSTPEQVIVVSGSQQGLDLAARLLLDPGEPAWVEDPGYVGARGALQAAGAVLVPVPVDAEGIDVAEGQRRAPAARVVYVTPSHQYPLGATLSLARRLALLEWAAATGAWILEDDYDSEYRYVGRPLASLQGLDTARRVIYLGTFSKVLFPGLRLGYMVVPPDLVDAFAAARALADRHPPGLEQAVLADFITEGHFARHIRRTRALYAERQAAFLAAARDYGLDRLLRLAPAETGLHLVGWLPPGLDDAAAARAAAVHGVDTQALSTFRCPGPVEADGERAAGGLLLGYAAVPPAQVRPAVAALTRALAHEVEGAGLERARGWWGEAPPLTAARAAGPAGGAVHAVGGVGRADRAAH